MTISRLLSRSGRGICAIATLILAALTPAAQAQTCPGAEGEPLPPRARWPQLDEHLEALMPQCQHEAAFLAYRGALKLAQGDIEGALHLLELAVLTNPGHLGAQIDLAFAFAANGDLGTSQRLAATLLERPDLPPAARVLLMQLEAPPEIPRQPGGRSPAFRWGGHIALLAGHDTNLNGAPNQSQLALTLPDGRYDLELLPDDQAQRGRALQLEARIGGSLELGRAGRLDLRGGLRTRETDDPRHRFEQFDTQAAWTMPLNRHTAWTTQLTLGQLRLAGSPLLDHAQLAGGIESRLGPCRTDIMLEFERRQFPGRSYLDGDTPTLGTRLGCPVGDGLLTAGIRLGNDHARDPGRAGGDQRRHEATARLDWPLGASRLSLQLTHVRLSDADGYSPLLEHNAPRRQTRQIVRLEWRYPIQRQWIGILAAEGNRQRSNLALFEASGNALWAGVQWTFGR